MDRITQMLHEKLAQAQQRTFPPQPPVSPGESTSEKVASDDDLLKLAESVEYVAMHLPKVAQGQGPGEGPNITELLQPTTQGGISVNGGASTTKTVDAGGTEPPSASVVNPSTAVQTDETSPPGAGDTMGPRDPSGSLRMSPAKTAAQIERVKLLIQKMAEGEPSAGPGKGPGATPMNVEQPPPIPSEGQPIQSTQSAVDLTKREAKQPVKEELKDYIKEPAQSKKTDPVASDMLDHADSAGVKMSAADMALMRAFLIKKAAQGCTCGEHGTCDYCQIKSAASECSESEAEKEKKKEQEKSGEPVAMPASIREAIKH